jgi:hypothetical protein
MLTSIIVEAKGLKSVLDKTTGNKEQQITVMLSVLVDGRKLTSFYILLIVHHVMILGK